MSRTSNDELNAEGLLINGYDYARQCWVVNGLYAECGHPERHRGCWGCNHAGEPYAPEAESTAKGSVLAVMVLGVSVEIWVSSPTGDASDSHILYIPCSTRAQAETVAQMWRKTWGVN
jgi:hypothetical protein